MTHADELRLLATSLRDQFLTIASPIISAQYIQAEEDLLSLPGLPWHEHAVVATRLAQHLRAEFEKTRDVLKLRRAIALRRDLLAHAPPGHPDRSVTCAELAVLLGLHPRKSSDLNSLDEAIGLQEEALSLTPPEHPFRARVCSDLAESLRGRFRSTQSDAALEDAIRLDREALRLRPVGHPDRLLSCINLAMSLWVQHTNAPSSSVLGEIISLQREALALLPRHHPNRAQHCEALAESLIVHFRDTRDAAVLEEAISFVRQAIELTPTHQHRKQSFLHNKLASHLTWLYYHSSGHQYATEAVQLRRRSLHLHSATDRNRDRQCSELGHSLHMLSTRTGDYTLLIEAVSYHRECLALRPVGHSKRDQACANLAVALTSLANWLHDVAHIDEAVALGKEALTLSTVGHPRRAETCKVLVSALMARFRITGDTSAIDETVVLAREALLLNSHDDFKKSRACKDLAEALTNRFLQTHETTAVEEAIMLHHKALDIYPPDHPSRWRMLVSLVRIHTEPHYTARDPSLAMDYLSQAISFEVDNLPRLLQNVMISLDRIEAVGVPDELKCALLQIYEKAVELVIYLTGYALSGTMQLEHLAACRTLGPRAYTLAVSLGHVDTALQVLERTRGVVWAQLLHMRDPQLHDVPPEMASQLSSLFSQLLSHDAPVSDDFAGRTYLSQRDVRHQQHGRVQRLLKEIRALPGMDGFLRGITLEAMKAAAIHHPVVVLFAGAGGCSAIIMRDADSPLFLLPLPNIRLSDLESTMLSTSTSSMRGGPDTGDRTIMISEGRRRGALGLDRLLERLWTNVVRPVLMHLGCIVSAHTHLDHGFVSDAPISRLKLRHESVFTGVRLVRLGSLQSTPLGSTKAPTKIVPPTTSYRPTRRHSQL
jgi:tetratricopeptide (TPR) repeat protein